MLELCIADQLGDIITHESDTTPLDYVTLASTTEGHTAADLKDLVGGAVQQSIIRSSQSDDQVGHHNLYPDDRADAKPGLIMDDFTAAQAAFTPLSLRGVSLQKSEVKWADIGGEWGQVILYTVTGAESRSP